MPSSKKMLSDGRNAHLIIESPDWWKDIIINISNNWKIINSESRIKLGKWAHSNKKNIWLR